MSQAPRLMLAALLALTGCKRTAPQETDPDASLPLPSLPLHAEGPGDDELFPPVPPHPLAVRVCTALHGLPVTRRAECCAQKPGFAAIQPCIHSLSSALTGTSTLTLSESRVSACESAMKVALSGCDWVGPIAPKVPNECRSLVSGTLPLGSPCRSSLQCASDLQCLGLSAATPGQCGPALPVGSMCRSGVDSVALMLRDESSRPECKNGYCARGRCEPLGGKDATCRSNVQCGPGFHCDGKACRPGAVIAAGQPCADGGCAPGARCIRNVCLQVKALGESCKNDLECPSACVDGKCGWTCKSAALLPKK
ncbi:MAG: hypothetical protein HY791_25750 [Deltaproteobacteria bacterium]|nr:hypothetical protein [Deltaproteobacteria bacterium]